MRTHEEESHMRSLLLDLDKSIVILTALIVGTK